MCLIPLFLTADKTTTTPKIVRVSVGCGAFRKVSRIHSFSCAKVWYSIDARWFQGSLCLVCRLCAFLSFLLLCAFDLLCSTLDASLQTGLRSYGPIRKKCYNRSTTTKTSLPNHHRLSLLPLLCLKPQLLRWVIGSLWDCGPSLCISVSKGLSCTVLCDGNPLFVYLFLGSECLINWLIDLKSGVYDIH